MPWIALKEELCLALRSSVRWFQIPFEGLSFVKTLVTFVIIYTIDPLLQNMTKIVRLHWLTFDIFNYKPLSTMLNCMRQFFKIRVVFHTRYLWNEDGDPQFFCISDTSNSLSDCSKNFKKIYWLENFCVNVRKSDDSSFSNTLRRNSLTKTIPHRLVKRINNLYVYDFLLGEGACGLHFY